MRYPLLVLIVGCFVIGACASQPLVAPQMPVQQAASPLLTITPAGPSSVSSLPHEVRLITSDFTDRSYIEHFAWQGDVLVTRFSEGQPQDRLRLSPTTEIWQRDRITVKDLQLGDYVSLFGADRGDGFVLADYVIVLSKVVEGFATIGDATYQSISTGKIESILSDNEQSEMIIQLTGSSLSIHVGQWTRAFVQHHVGLDAVEESSDLVFRGALFNDSIGHLVEVKQAVILSKPSQYAIQDYPLHCNQAKSVAHCHDDYLGIEFDYPAAWGQATGEFIPSRHIGYSYNYIFANISFSNTLVMAGGRSDPFVEPRDGFPTDFGGFGNDTPEQVCERLGAVLCEKIEPGVLFMIRVPNAQSICNPGPGIGGRPEAVIAVDLPGHKQINGLIFVTAFLSEAAEQALALLAPNAYSSPPQNCDDAGQARFDAYMQQLLQQLRGGLVDAKTQTNLQILRNMARSFHGEPLPK